MLLANILHLLAFDVERVTGPVQVSFVFILGVGGSVSWLAFSGGHVYHLRPESWFYCLWHTGHTRGSSE